MAYVKKSIGANEEVKPYLDGLEGRIDGAFGEVDRELSTTKRETKYLAGGDFRNGWGNYNDYNGIFEQVLLTKVNGVVTIEGLVKPGTQKVIAVLPVGFRPRKILVFPAYTSGGMMRLDVAPNGEISSEKHDVSFLSLSGITFLAQN